MGRPQTTLHHQPHRPRSRTRRLPPLVQTIRRRRTKGRASARSAECTIDPRPRRRQRPQPIPPRHHQLQRKRRPPNRKEKPLHPPNLPPHPNRRPGRNLFLLFFLCALCALCGENFPSNSNPALDEGLAEIKEILAEADHPKSPLEQLPPQRQQALYDLLCEKPHRKVHAAEQQKLQDELTALSSASAPDHAVAAEKILQLHAIKTAKNKKSEPDRINKAFTILTRYTNAQTAKARLAFHQQKRSSEGHDTLNKQPSWPKNTMSRGRKLASNLACPPHATQRIFWALWRLLKLM